MNWNDAISSISTAVVMIVLFGGVRLRSGRNFKDRLSVQGSKMICSCGHGYGTHEAHVRCHGEILHWIYVACPCRSYDGPKPELDPEEIVEIVRSWTPPVRLAKPDKEL